MNHYQDLMVAQSMAAEREHELQELLRARRHGAVVRQHGRRAAAVRQTSLRARIAHIWAMSH